MNTPSGATKSPKVVIVGSGLGGVGLAVELKRAGLHNFVILEQADDLGGVWRDNTYPGAACDVPSTLYSYSFERKTVIWPHRYSGQADIHKYVGNVAKKYGILPHIRYNAKVVAADFDATSSQWTLMLENGEEIQTDVFVPAVGQLSRPKIPSIVGRDEFAGPSFHSAQWRHDVSLEGKRVAVIGTGASALQFVPHVQKQVATLTVFQRSAPYVMPYHNYSYDQWPHRILRANALQSADRFTFWYAMEFGQQVLTRWLRLSPLIRSITSKHLAKQVTDPVLREKLTPRDEPGCKRVLFSSKWYPALTQPNVDVVSEDITEIVPNGVRTADGKVHEVDVIIYGTGFRTNDYLGHVKITGLGNRVLSEQWKEGAHAYLGMATPNFPNLFFVYGPNTDVGSGSVLYMLESQFPYIRQAIEKLATMPGAHITIRDDVWQKFDREIQSKLNKTVWTSGCSNWYRNEHGRVVTNWPMRCWVYRRQARLFDLTNYRIAVAERAAQAPSFSNNSTSGARD